MAIEGTLRQPSRVREITRSRADTSQGPQQRNEPLPAGLEDQESWIGWDEWDEFELGPVRDELWDVFELDEETAEPEPQYGDFWGEPDDEEPI